LRLRASMTSWGKLFHLSTTRSQKKWRRRSRRHLFFEILRQIFRIGTVHYAECLWRMRRHGPVIAHCTDSEDFPTLAECPHVLITEVMVNRSLNDINVLIDVLIYSAAQLQECW